MLLTGRRQALLHTVFPTPPPLELAHSTRHKNRGVQNHPTADRQPQLVEMHQRRVKCTTGAGATKVLSPMPSLQPADEAGFTVASGDCRNGSYLAIEFVV
jgi:hypothetical protein